MPEPKPTYKVNPAINPNAAIWAACENTKRLLLEAVQAIAPVCSKQGTITVDYTKWDTMNNVLGAINEKYIEWQNTTQNLYCSARILSEISDLLKKAGY
ncbi:MAG: hypothetical protein WC998_01645 [Candidatus Paceibacterota bacterium]|jgi:hypothetical protein